MLDQGLGAKVRTKIPLAKARRIAARVMRDLDAVVSFILPVGSIRRNVPKIGDVEFVVLPTELGEFLEHVGGLGFSGGERIQRARMEGRPIELWIAHSPEEIGSMVFGYTGDAQFEQAMRMKAKRRGLKLNQYGLWDAEGNLVLQSPDEQDFFEALDVEWHEPEERNFLLR